MRPLPSEEIIHKLKSYKIISTPKSSTTKALTQIFKTSFLKKEIIWTFPEYIGQKVIFLSPDGKTIILFGNQYFPGLIKSNNSEELIVILTENKRKTLRYSDIANSDLEKHIKKYNISEIGGGWIRTSDFIKLENVKWKEEKLIFLLKNNIRKEKSFKD